LASVVVELIRKGNAVRLLLRHNFGFVLLKREDGIAGGAHWELGGSTTKLSHMSWRAYNPTNFSYRRAAAWSTEPLSGNAALRSTSDGRR
jgi:hypothetical protein